MDEALREWADVLRGIANEIDSVADKIKEGIYVSPEDIERLTSGQMIPNVDEARPVKPIDVSPVLARADNIYIFREAQRAEQHIVANTVWHIERDLGRGLTVRLEYENGKVTWFRPGDEVVLPPW